jgi:N-acetylglucosamine repressor
MKLSSEQTACIESEILKRVRSYPGISRISLARKLQIAPSTIGNYTGRLIAQGYLKESESEEKTEIEAGRPPTALQLNPDGGQFIGVDFEARNIMVTSVDFSDHPLKHAHRHILETDSVADILGKIEAAITEVLPGEAGQLLAIGVGVPGFVDPVRGLALHYKYIKHWENVRMVEPLARRFNVPVYLENNVRSMALAELWFGQGRGVNDWFCLGIPQRDWRGDCSGRTTFARSRLPGRGSRALAPGVAGAAGRAFFHGQHPAGGDAAGTAGDRLGARHSRGAGTRAADEAKKRCCPRSPIR